MGATRVSVLITGGRGQLGRELQRALRAPGRRGPASLKAGLLDVEGAEVLALDLPELDVTDAGAVERAIGQARPDLVIHAAALTDTSLCEEDPDLAMRVNAQGALHVAEACRRIDAAMVYVSTNEVFDGPPRREPYGESDEPRPVNAYGRSKLEGERLVRDRLPRCYVVRTSWLYAEGGDNFPAKVLRLAFALGESASGGQERPASRTGRRELSMVTDEVATPTWARDLAQAIIRLVGHPAYGTYHLTNAGWCSRYEWAAEVLRLAGRPWADVTLRPITSAEYGGGGPPKPPFSALRNEAAARLGITLRSWQEALGEYFGGG